MTYVGTGSGCLLVYTKAKQVKSPRILVEPDFSLTQRVIATYSGYSQQTVKPLVPEVSKQRE